MRSNGWDDRPGVRILEGKWQDYLGDDAPKVEFLFSDMEDGGDPERAQGGAFDLVYTDTFSEEYSGECDIAHISIILH